MYIYTNTDIKGVAELLVDVPSSAAKQSTATLCTLLNLHTTLRTACSYAWFILIFRQLFGLFEVWAWRKMWEKRKGKAWPPIDLSSWLPSSICSVLFVTSCKTSWQHCTVPSLIWHLLVHFYSWSIGCFIQWTPPIVIPIIPLLFLVPMP